MFCGGPFAPSSETQGQIVGARESLNGWKNMARRKVKNGEKSPCGQCLTRPVPNGHRRSGFWFVPENFCVFLPNQKPEWRRPFGTGVVRHCPQGLFSPFFTFRDQSDFGWHRFRFHLAFKILMRNRVAKSEAILALLDTFLELQLEW